MNTTDSTVATQQEIIITGFGGQGIILAGRIIGMAASLGDNRESTLTQAYGPESRGGACNAQVIISDRPIHYPYVKTPHILVAMSQAGYDKFTDLLTADAILLTDQDLVPKTAAPCPHYAISATRMAEGLGNKMMANIIMIGFFTAITGAVSKQAAQDMVLQSVPKGTEEKNTNAFNKGYDYGVSTLKGKEKRAAGKTGAIAS
ncbi:2-oxoacid:acceptor oxidoreductase family protein [Desulfoprunum benzoelyticum]|uniref:2-oxoglutarate ferredoxin oxidoreductase subunit gamma n=1 Tax=Desulfoprunum benzoelyticum TaxID=1506996 RepID=A0A840V5T3_9BACT|nr:2-oxoacid:acceptor oxidoreductase family protein [Desulfoprunum benzoelyticum]MBB5349270.1 2-oxoglutarate ferredoxin oxidoreductase subunit gamma [Desulfoprunum benzoelyticum]MBM9530982.1 2-oxoacid:acceptor oxidoreductase family protein [Desulfoprunum benzoelyticum]